MLTVPTLLTAEEFFALPDHEHAELLDGEVIETVPPTPAHGQIAAELTTALKIWVRETKAGIVGVEGGFIVKRAPDRVRGPDVWFMHKDNVPNPEPEGFWSVIPDFIVEIVSSSDTAEVLKEKLEDYFVAGARRIWVVYPRFKQVDAHSPDGTARTFRESDTLEDTEVLPGFRCAVAELFT